MAFALLKKKKIGEEINAVCSERARQGGEAAEGTQEAEAEAKRLLKAASGCQEGCCFQRSDNKAGAAKNAAERALKLRKTRVRSSQGRSRAKKKQKEARRAEEAWATRKKAAKEAENEELEAERFLGRHYSCYGRKLLVI